MSEFPYGAYYSFFAKWFGNVFFITFAFLLWVVCLFDGWWESFDGYWQFIEL